MFSALLVSFAAGQAQSGTISGRVTGPNGTTPLEGIEVTAYRWNDQIWDSFGYRAGWEWVNSDGTDVNGNYSIPDLAADRYRIEFDDSYWPYVYSEEVYDNAPDLDAGRDVVVASQASTVSGVNASLCASSHITGRVTGPDGTTPIEGVRVQAYRQSSLGDWVGYYSVYTDANGDFDIIGLSAGVYRIHFDPFNGVHASEYYSNKPDQNSANSVSVSASSTVSGVNATLDLIQPRTIHRFWSSRYRGHFFTIDEAEKNNIVANLSQDWSYEGEAYTAFLEQKTGTVPLYRFWSNRYRGHFFTVSDDEADNIIYNLSRDWSYEGIAYYVYPDAGAGGTPVYRFWSNRYKHHFFTISESEKDNIVAKLSKDWSYEGIAYYVPSARAASPSGALPAVASAAFAGDADVAAASAEKVVAKAAALPAAAPVALAPVSGDVLFPLTMSGGKVTAKISDMESGEDAEVLADADAPVAVSGVETGRRYRLEISVEGPDSAASRIVHASAFERRADAPDGLGDVDAAQAVAGTGVGNPVERIVAPAGDGRISLKLWSAAHGVVETREGVAGGDAVEFAIPDWNCWHWIGGWREPDDELVFSLWLRHELD